MEQENEEYEEYEEENFDLNSEEHVTVAPPLEGPFAKYMREYRLLNSLLMLKSKQNSWESMIIWRYLLMSIYWDPLIMWL